MRGLPAAHPMQFIRVLPRVGLDVSLGNGLVDEHPRFDFGEWYEFDARESVKLWPDVSDRVWPVRAAGDPDWNLLSEKSDKSRDTQRSLHHVIERDRLGAAM